MPQAERFEVLIPGSGAGGAPPAESHSVLACAGDALFARKARAVMDRHEFSLNHEKSLREATRIQGPGCGVLHAVQRRMDHACKPQAIVGDSPPFRAALAQVSVVAPTDATVLILGETGTGKELIARAIHSQSERRGRPFIKMNCASIPSGLLESELFGHERGAFTGAIGQMLGRFERADGGTLFLDEVGDIPPELQPKLLRVLQEQEFERLGGTRTIKVDVRLIAATNRDLARMVEAREYRSDLYYRLNVFPIDVPPLRDRPEDVVPLAYAFVARFADRMQRRIDVIPEASLNAMRRYAWPGNVRELENLMERAVILSSGRTLDVPLADLAWAVRRGDGHDDVTTLAGVERTHIVRVLEKTRWVLGGPRGAAVRLGVQRTTLQSLMQRLDIHRPTAVSLYRPVRAVADRMSA